MRMMFGKYWLPSPSTKPLVITRCVISSTAARKHHVVRDA
jgi:hypothetical protein